MKISKTVKISGHEADVNTIITMLRHMEYLGEVGSSRNILVRVDGDGCGRIHVYNEDGSKIDNNHYNTEQNINGPLVAVYDIGGNQEETQKFIDTIKSEKLPPLKYDGRGIDYINKN